MSFPQVDWTLEQLASVADAQPAEHPLRRVDRDDSEVYETGDSIDMAAPIRNRLEDLKKANYVGATLASRERSPVGTEYDYATGDVVRVRIEGMHHSEWGHIDPHGEDGVVFSDLVDAVQNAADSAATYPQIPDYDGRYTHLFVTNDAPAMNDWADFWQYSFDIELSGYETR